MNYNRGKNYWKHLKHDFNRTRHVCRYEFDPSNPDDHIINQIIKQNSNNA